MLKVVLAPLVTYILQLPLLPETSGGIEGKAKMLEILVLPSTNPSPPRSHKAQSPQIIFICFPSV